MILPVLTVRYLIYVVAILAFAGTGSTEYLEIDYQQYAKNFTLFFQWINSSCVPTYQISLVSATPNHFVPNSCPKEHPRILEQTEKVEYSYLNAFADYTYNISVKAFCNETVATDKVENTTSFSTLSTGSGAANLSTVNPFLDNQNTIRAVVSWKVPCDTNGDINQYVISLYRINPIVEDLYIVPASNNETYNYEIVGLLPKTNYTAYVTADGGDIGTDVPFSTGDSLPQKPEIVDVTVTSSSFAITWNITEEYTDQIENFTITIIPVGFDYDCDNCNIDPTPINITLGSNKRTYTFSKAEPAFQYNLTVGAVNIVGAIDSKTEEVHTKPGVPEPPKIIINDKGSTSFNISWIEPQNKNGQITGYFLNITPIGRHYDYNRENSNCIRNETSLQLNLTNITTNYMFEDAKPYSGYNISLSASTETGYGNVNTFFVLTNTDVPEAPIDLTIDNLTYEISWELPCNTNGPTEYFNGSIYGYYTEDTNINQAYNFTEKFTEGVYIYKITPEFHESYFYSVDVSVSLNDTAGDNGTATITTDAGIPGKPLNISINSNILNSSLWLSWSPPMERKGRILGYDVKIVAVEPLYSSPQYCNIQKNTTTYNTSINSHYIKTPIDVLYYYNYSISVRAITSKGQGEYADIFCESVEGVPEQVNIFHDPITDVTPTEEYNATATITFNHPCLLNGPLDKYILTYYYTDFPSPNYLNTSESLSFTFPLVKPETMYNYSIEVFNTKYSTKTEMRTFRSPAGAPSMTITPESLSLDRKDNEVTFVLRKEYFTGLSEVKYIALILAENEIKNNQSIVKYEPGTWPNITNPEMGIYQLTDDRWAPFTMHDSVTFTIGEGPPECSNLQSHCNKPLESNKQYYLLVRAYTNSIYRNSPVISFKTSNVTEVAIIVGTLFGILVPVGLGFLAFIIWRRKMIQLPGVLYIKSSSSTKHIPIINTSIPVKKFIQYCKFLENNPEKMKEQYILLEEKSKEMILSKSTNFAQLPENKRKNRYINILAYDETRVKLLIDEDDDMGTDYINASYIKGYTGQIEYIATQGPLETTCRDFWKMILQENVSIIVMVSQFIENDKLKCYRYFPKNRESMFIEDIEIRCSNELHFGIYCVRMLQIRKDTVQANVIHMQFLEWPDFEVPVGTEHMLQFCYQLRQRITTEGGCTVIHCSAGVGRTGTLIATDMMLQAANAKKNIDIFNTVFELRKQRINMVQTKTQYNYIHNLIKDHIDRPPTPDSIEAASPIYENVSVLQDQNNDKKISTSKKKLTGKENEESKF